MYSKEEYLTTDKPYRTELFPVLDTKLQLEQAKQKLRADAIEQGVKAKEIDAMLEGYVKQERERLKKEAEAVSELVPLDTTPGVILGDLRLKLPGNWDFDGWQIKRTYKDFQAQIVSYHPIFPCARVEDIDTGLESLTITFQLNKRYKDSGEGWKTYTDTKTAFFDRAKILRLSEKCGVAVSSENAGLLSTFLCVTAQENYEQIPLVRQTHKAGWNKYGFAPYKEIEPVELIRMPELSHKGNYDLWKQEIAKACKRSTEFKILEGAAVISPLLKILGINNFVVHLMSDKSGIGKTVALMGVGSTYGDPAQGKYLKSADSTTVGMERLCMRLQNLPLILDEMQTAKDSRGRTKFNIYKVAEGGGRSKAGKDEEIQSSSEYHLTILTSGESSIIKQEDGEGAYNRVIELEAKASLFEDGHYSANIFRNNYGLAADDIITYIIEHGDEIKKEFDELYSWAINCWDKQYGGKQIQMAVACSLGFNILNKAVFNGELNELAVEEVLNRCKQLEETSITAREYQDLLNWASGNDIHFSNDTLDKPIERWGEYDSKDPNVLWILQRVFTNFLKESGYEPRGAKRALENAGYIAKGRGNTHRFMGRVQKMIPLALPPDKKG